MKRGYQTSEFWLTLGTLIGMVTGVVYGALPRGPATFVVGAIVIGYSIGRGLAKQQYEETPDNINHPACRSRN